MKHPSLGEKYNFFYKAVNQNGVSLESPYGEVVMIPLYKRWALYVTDQKASRVVRFDADGTHWGARNTTVQDFIKSKEGGLSQPWGITISPKDGDVYVSSAGRGGEVLKFDGCTGEAIRRVALVPGEPRGLALHFNATDGRRRARQVPPSDEGQLYIASHYSDEILQVSLTSNYKTPTQIPRHFAKVNGKPWALNFMKKDLYATSEEDGSMWRVQGPHRENPGKLQSRFLDRAVRSATGSVFSEDGTKLYVMGPHSGTSVVKFGVPEESKNSSQHTRRLASSTGVPGTMGAECDTICSGAGLGGASTGLAGMNALVRRDGACMCSGNSKEKLPAFEWVYTRSVGMSCTKVCASKGTMCTESSASMMSTLVQTYQTDSHFDTVESVSRLADGLTCKQVSGADAARKSYVPYVEGDEICKIYRSSPSTDGVSCEATPCETCSRICACSIPGSGVGGEVEYDLNTSARYEATYKDVSMKGCHGITFHHSSLYLACKEEIRQYDAETGEFLKVFAALKGMAASGLEWVHR